MSAYGWLQVWLIGTVSVAPTATRIVLGGLGGSKSVFSEDCAISCCTFVTLHLLPHSTFYDGLLYPELHRYETKLNSFQQASL